jgi:poly(3-hydroxybutyrate) depolymerase
MPENQAPHRKRTEIFMSARKSLLAASAAATLSFAGCSSGSDDPGGTAQAGSGGSNQAGASHAGGPAVAGTGATGQSGAGGVGRGGSAGASSGLSGNGGASASGGSAGSTSGVGGGSGAGGTAGAGMAGASGGGMGGAGGSGPQSAGCGRAPTIPSSMYNNGQRIAIMAGSMQRQYILSVPSNYDNTKPYKLVIAYHQLNGDDNQMYKNDYYHLKPLSNDTTIFVAPNGQKNGASCTSADGCGWPNSGDSDLALADAIVKQLKDNFCIDNNRVFATGWSYGGSMSYKTACERPLGKANGFVRAIAIYSAAQLSGNCTPNTPVAFYGSHGDNDSVLGYDGGVGLAQNFAKANGCSWATPTKVTSGNHMCTDVMGCMTGYPTRFCAFDGDHTPDPKDPNQQTSWEYQEAWKFLNQF